MTLATGSPSSALTRSVAPNCSAMSSFDWNMSMAMIRSAPAILAPWITLRPTPPQPMTATVSPLRMSAVLRAAPTPVSTPQPMSAAKSKVNVVVDLHQRRSRGRWRSPERAATSPSA